MRRSGLKMKLTHQRMTGRYESTPESVLDWLEEQLECRGIDAVVYTRYILSLLQDYDSDQEDEVVPPIPQRDMSGFCCDRVVRRHSGLKENLKPVPTNKWKHRRYRTTCPDIGQDCWPHYQCNPINSDHERKLAVVQCLKSASEQEFGIESFVDELCAKLKNIKLLSETLTDSATDVSTDDSTPEITNNNNGAKVSPKEQAMKYYAAFPALDNNCNEETPLSSKSETCVTPHQTVTRTSSDKSKWNGQKIIEFMNCSNGCGLSVALTDALADGLTDSLTSDSINCQIDGNESTEQKEKKSEIDSNEMKDNEKSETNFFYCEDIESNVMDVPLVDNQDTKSGYSVLGVQENDRFERLVNKFNHNIASIWSTTETDAILARNDNIWSFDSSFSSNQSSATPSPKCFAIDLWSSLTSNELNETLTEKRGPSLDWWKANVFNNFSDDGFIDGNHELFDEEINWHHLGSDLIERETNRTSLQNHQKNSPFIEFNSMLSSNGKTHRPDPWHNIPEFSKLLSANPFLDESDNRLSPVMDENLLTSPKTHFEPIKQDSFERDESEDESFSDITDKEVKLVICSEKCPNNGDTKPHQPTYDSLRFRPISTSFGELASFMGPFNDFEWNGSEYPLTKLKIKEQDQFEQISDKSRDTESESPIDMKTKLPAVVMTSPENEPEYQDLYQMINEVLRNGISEDSTPIGSSSLTVSDDCEHNNESTDYTYVSNNLSFSCYTDLNKCHSIEDNLHANDSQMNIHQRRSELERSSSDNTVDEMFGDQLFNKSSALFDYLGDCEANDDVFDDSIINQNKFDSIYSAPTYDYPMALSSAKTRELSLNSPLNLQYKRRHNQNVGQSTGQPTGRVRKPCSFFIEGNCKRSDCKYSHEISAITCKYWEEGFCFKAELCPFLHGYLDDSNDVNIDSVDSKLYAIESESDFPSLSTKCGDSQPITPIGLEADPSESLKHHFFDFHTKSVSVNNGSVGSAKAKLPIAVTIKKKLRKRKDRNLQ